jgi:hypothetical protein
MISHEQNHKIMDETCPIPLFPLQTPYGQPREWTKAYIALNYLLKLLFGELIYVEDTRLWNVMTCRLANIYEDIFRFNEISEYHCKDKDWLVRPLILCSSLYEENFRPV